MSKVDDLLKKHKPLSPAEIEKTIVDNEQAKAKYTKDISTVEDNLTNFLQKEEPIIDPFTNEVIAWFRQAPIVELEVLKKELEDKVSNLSEAELEKLMETDEELKYIQFKLMAKLITKPKHDAKWWAHNATPEFIKLFESALVRVYERLLGNIPFF